MALERLFLERGCFRAPSGKPVYLIGANFWPKNSGPFAYRDPWDAAAIGRDLDELASLGANCARIFCFWPDFMPEPDSVSPEALSRFDALVDLCAGRGLWSIPTFLVGHMSGENWDPRWRGQRDLYADEFALQCQERMIAAVAGKYKEDPRIAAWLVTNEWPLYAGPTSDDRGIAWAQRMCAELQAADPSRPISLGDGAWDLVWGQPTGLPARRLAPIVDFFGPHFYPKETDSLRQSLVAPFTMEMTAPLGRPVLLEEFGCSSDQADDARAADYYRTTLWAAFGAGNCGALAWNSHDFDLPYRRPYSHHPYELHFGLIRSDGTPKPQAQEFARFARYAASHDPDEWTPVRPRAAIARTAFFLETFPFDWGWTRAQLRDLYLETYALCVAAGIPAAFIDLSALPSSIDAAPPAGGELRAYDLLIVPCLQQITMQNAAQLEAFARGGGTVYASYGGEPWHGDLRAFIGARPLVRYGLVEGPPRATVTLKFVEHFGYAKPGDVLPIAVRGEPRRTAYLPCEPEAAEVLAVDDAGRPALLRRRAGSGRVVFCTYPLEYYLLDGLDANVGSDTWRIYEALVHDAGAFTSLAVPSPGLQSFEWTSRRQPGRRRLLLVNHNDGPVSTQFGLGPEIADVESGARVPNRNPIEGLELGPKEVRLLDVVGPASA